ncbi:uncharacterized protein LOC111268063 isoform X2 [Varroa jacobsoni]|uniref:uncharacterized protein LOC111268063 isoform X2 n=1 Tax=Varroa jacobsoni TaxID=62625 RepID=UPI000BF34676|nr:uncharacterized protein LOC111268063 isoform X2 [Varroa jacobsoni]
MPVVSGSVRPTLDEEEPMFGMGATFEADGPDPDDEGAPLGGRREKSPPKDVHGPTWKHAWRRMGDKVSSYVTNAMTSSTGAHGEYGGTIATRTSVSTRLAESDPETVKAV